MKEYHKKYLPLIIVTIAEATIGIWVKLTGDAIPIFTLNFYRVFFALLFLTAALPLFDKRFFKLDKDDIKPAVIIGLLIAMQISTFNIAMTLAPIANVVILWSTYPFFVFILSALFLGERVDLEHLLIFVLGFIGIFLSEPFAGAESNVMGNSISLLGGLIYGCLITYMRKEDKEESTGIVFWFFVFASLFLLPALFIFGPGNLFALQEVMLFGSSFALPPILWAMGLGVIATGVAYLFITVSLQKINANIYSLVDIIVSPGVAAILGFLILREIPSSNMVIGGSILIIAAFLLTRKISKQEAIKHKKMLEKG